MKDKKLIITVAFLAVFICLIMTALLFYAVPPRFLVILSFIIGTITGMCIILLIQHLAGIIRSKRSKNGQTSS
jgi:uncharacterized RDD family membrane protein YckC